MKVFISWSGETSKHVAMVLRDWLPSVIQQIEPYMSTEDIEKGSRWGQDIADELEKSSVGILCLTKDNLNAPWLNFEAGAISKNFGTSRVCPFLFGLKRSEVRGPLTQFQSVMPEKDDILKLIKTLNLACEESAIAEPMLDKAFDIWLFMA